MTAIGHFVGDDVYLERGIAIAAGLATRAIWLDGLCAFFGATSPESLSHPPRFRSMGGDVYEGSAGIARCLALAAVISGDTRLRDTAIGATKHALARVDGWSLFSGGIGIGLVALELAELLEEPSFAAAGCDLVDAASLACCKADVPHDLLSGIAGVVVGLVAARSYDSDGQWTLRANELGRKLLAEAIRTGPAGRASEALSWPVMPGSNVRLCGLAHGASGVAHAFEALARVATDQTDWRAAARQARNYERAHYSAELGSFADLRGKEFGTGSVSYPHMWCHGSIGIAAERLGALDDLLARADATGALAGARQRAQHLLGGPVGPGAGDAINGSLCHGLSSLIDLFIDAWQASDDESWLGLARDIGNLMILDGERPQGLRSGVPGGWSAPGLMLGEAGMGWSLLRLARPGIVPSGWRIGSLLGHGAGLARHLRQATTT